MCHGGGLLITAVCVSMGARLSNPKRTAAKSSWFERCDHAGDGGIALFRAIRQQGIHIPAIFITGHLRTNWKSCRQKPRALAPQTPTLKQLIELILQVLEA
jgi:hypothetical protein